MLYYYFYWILFFVHDGFYRLLFFISLYSKRCLEYGLKSIYEYILKCRNYTLNYTAMCIVFEEWVDGRKRNSKEQWHRTCLNNNQILHQIWKLCFGFQNINVAFISVTNASKVKICFICFYFLVVSCATWNQAMLHKFQNFFSWDFQRHLNCSPFYLGSSSACT